MKKSERFVFDTNVLISALLTDGSTSSKAFQLATNIGIILASSATLQEKNANRETGRIHFYLSIIVRRTPPSVSIPEAIEINAQINLPLKSFQALQPVDPDYSFEFINNKRCFCFCPGNLHSSVQQSLWEGLKSFA
jgi:hypothetical protein